MSIRPESAALEERLERLESRFKPTSLFSGQSDLTVEERLERLESHFEFFLVSLDRRSQHVEFLDECVDDLRSRLNRLEERENERIWVERDLEREREEMERRVRDNDEDSPAA